MDTLVNCINEIESEDIYVFAAIISCTVIITTSVVCLIEQLRVARFRAKIQKRYGGPGRLQAARNQPAGMRANAAAEESDQWEEVEQEAGAGAAANAQEAERRLEEPIRAQGEYRARREQAQREQAELLEELTPEEEEELIRLNEEEYEALNKPSTMKRVLHYLAQQKYKGNRRIKDLVVYIKDKKVFIHEELTALYQLENPEAVITEMKESAEYFGVIDHGKFMYLLQ